VSQASRGAPFQEERSSEEVIYYFQNDHLGTSQIVTDGKGLIVWKATYKPFGEAEVELNSTVVNNFRFPGQYFDKETGLHYNYHRHYDPGIGRYLRPDFHNITSTILVGRALEFSDVFDQFPRTALGYPNDVVNPYLYVSNNALNWIDPYGLFKWKTFGYGIFEVSVGIGSVAAGYATILGTGCIGAAVGITAIYEGMFVLGVGLTDIIGAFYEEEPFVSKLPEKIDIYGRKIPFGSLIYPLPPDVFKKKKQDSCEK